MPLTTDILKDLADSILFGSSKEKPAVVETGERIIDTIFSILKELMSGGGVLHPLNLLLYGYPNSLNLLPACKRASDSAQQVKKAVKLIIQERSRLKPTELGTNILDLIIKNNMDPNSAHKFSDDEIVGDLALFLFAGSDSTSRALTTLVYMTAQHQDVQGKIRNEMVQKSLNNGQPYSLDQIDSVDWLSAMLKESLRLHSPAPASFDRMIFKDMKLGKYSFNKGDKIVIPFCAQFVNEDLFP